jgi:hypothetical protein
MNAVTECELGYLRRFSVLGTDMLLRVRVALLDFNIPWLARGRNLMLNCMYTC